MTKLNCWEFKKCGRELKGKNAHDLGICPATVFDESDGFCDGKNGGRACMYIAGTFCLEIIPGTHREASKDCGSCDFHRMLKEDHGSEISVFSFQEYVRERNKDFMGITGHEIYNVSPLLRKEHLAEADSQLQKDNLNDIWLHLLGLVDYCNRAVKQGEWYQEDVDQFYGLKDSVMEKLYRQSPPGATVNLKKVLYRKSSNNNEDDTISQSQHKHFPVDSGYSPELEQPSRNINMQETILIEMEVTYEGRMFCFHISAEKVKDWELNVMALSYKKWIPSREFNRQFFKEVFEEIRVLLNFISLLETENAKLQEK